jgi:hypothetical protein
MTLVGLVLFVRGGILGLLAQLRDKIMRKGDGR